MIKNQIFAILMFVNTTLFAQNNYHLDRIDINDLVDIPIFANLICIKGGVVLDQIYARWTSIDIENNHYRIMRSTDEILWEEVGSRTAYGTPYSPVDYMWVGEGIEGMNYIRIYDSHDVLIVQLIIYFEKNIRTEINGQKIR